MKPVVHKPLAFGLLKGSLDAAVILAILKVSENHPNTAKWMARISLGGRIAVDVNNIRVVMKF